jgi:predicted amidohydrolase
MFSLIIYNGRIVSASGVSETNVWVGIEGEKITTVSSAPVPLDECLRSIDARGALVTPGGMS